jgi:hypothetical protein
MSPEDVIRLVILGVLIASILWRPGRIDRRTEPRRSVQAPVRCPICDAETEGAAQ